MTATGTAFPVVAHKDSVRGARVDLLSLGALARSQKENERRLAIHPLHLDQIDASLRQRIYLEHGYGERFGMPDEQLAGRVAGLRSRRRLLADCDVILLPKPLPQDLADMREGQVLWGVDGHTACRTRTSPSWASTGG